MGMSFVTLALVRNLAQGFQIRGQIEANFVIRGKNEANNHKLIT